jgi:carbon monoxide dehydrogenase subunit G
MELKGRYVFDAPVTRVWEGLMDPTVLAACLPGCQKFEADGEDQYRVRLTAGVSMVTGTFEGTVRIADKDPERSYRLLVEGRGRPGFVDGESTITLSASDAGVVVDVAAKMTVGGLIAQVGQRLLHPTAHMMMDKFFKCLQGKI